MDNSPALWRSRLRKTSNSSSPSVCVTSPDLDDVTDELKKKLNMRRSGSTSSSDGTKIDKPELAPLKVSRQRKRPSDCGLDSTNDDKTTPMTKKLKISPKKTLKVNELAAVFAQKAEKSSASSSNHKPISMVGQKLGKIGDAYGSKQLAVEVANSLKVKAPVVPNAQQFKKRKRLTEADPSIDQLDIPLNIDQRLRNFSSSRRRVIPARQQRGSKNPVKTPKAREDVRDDL